MPLDEERHSQALEIELISDPEQKARQEAKNGLRQFDEVIELINYWLQPTGHSNFASPQSCRSTAAPWRGLVRLQVSFDLEG